MVDVGASRRTNRPRLIVMFEEGAVTPSEVMLSLTDWADLMLVLGDSPYTQVATPFLTEIAETTPWNQPRDELLSILRRWHPDGIITYAERMLGPTAEVADALGLLFHTVDTATHLRDKYAQRLRLAEAGVQHTRIAYFRGASQWRNIAAEVGFPLVVKPRLGEGGQYTHLVRDIEEGATLIGVLEQSYQGVMVAEEFIVGRQRPPFGDYVSVESCAVDGNISHLEITGKFPILPPFREQGHFWPAPVTAAERAAILNLTGRALVALGVSSGLTHTEVKLTAAGPRLIEVNGRIGGQINDLALRACGVDLIAAAARIAIGERMDELALQPRETYFQYHNSPPLHARRLTGVDGVAATKAVEGVASYEIYLRPPAPLERGVGTSWIDVVRGHARDHNDMLAVLDRANAPLSFTYETTDGVATLPSMWTLQQTGAIAGTPSS